MDYTLEYINNMVQKDPKGFVEECDAAYHARIVEAADKVCDLSLIHILRPALPSFLLQKGRRCKSDRRKSGKNQYKLLYQQKLGQAI